MLSWCKKEFPALIAVCKTSSFNDSGHQRIWDGHVDVIDLGVLSSTVAVNDVRLLPSHTSSVSP